MVGFGWIKTPAGLDPRDNRPIERVRLVELRDIGLRRRGLLIADRENCRAILGSRVRSLAVQLRRIMSHGEIDLQDAAVTDLAGIEGDLHRFSMVRRAAAHPLVVRRLLVAAAVARDGVADALDMLKHALHAPEAAAGEHGDLRARRRGRVDGGGGYRARFFGA